LGRDGPVGRGAGDMEPFFGKQTLQISMKKGFPNGDPKITQAAARQKDIEGRKIAVRLRYLHY
jgi:hypothetical protein